MNEIFFNTLLSELTLANSRLVLYIESNAKVMHEILIENDKY